MHSVAGQSTCEKKKTILFNFFVAFILTQRCVARECIDTRCIIMAHAHVAKVRLFRSLDGGLLTYGGGVGGGRACDDQKC